MDDFQVLLIFFIMISSLVQILILRNKKINVEILISMIFLIIFACSIVLIREYAFSKIFVYVAIIVLLFGRVLLDRIK
ncbi:hypothetical protein [Abyssisolibacter fermentans]|uniref:hypothetical protein n=1 Tax=Abyssisolibacter fermentans TaxID=1766203 RepID=UPI00082CBE17|nr:hypothetical protein [Abyssisolibacter fermentans]